MARTDISICSRALMNLGAAPITSFDDTSDAAQMLAISYPEIRDGIISAYAWECMKVRKELTRAAEAPGGYQYAFVMPSDLLGGPSGIFPSADDTIGTNAFEVRRNRIVSNLPRAWIEYQARRTEAEWPAWFAELVMAAVAAEMALMVTDQQSVKDHWEAKAFGTPSENRVGGLMGQAMTLDAQNSGNNPGIVSTALLEARFGGVVPGFEGW